MDWAKGYSASYYMATVDSVTWHDTGRIELTGGSIKRETSGLRESADIDCVDWPAGIEQWVRVYLNTSQEGSMERVALFTGLATSPDNDFSGGLQENSVECYSVLKPAEDVYLKRGWYAPAGMSGGSIIKQLLEVTPAPVQVAENAPRLTSSIIAEDDETNLSMIDKILLAINWRIRITGDGVISVEPKPTEPVAAFNPLENDVIELEVSVSRDLFDCPNVFRAIDDDMTAVARDDSIDSPLSTVNRGREVWAQESNCDLADNESIEEYAARRLKELQKVGKTADYKRRYIPDLFAGDLVRMYYPEQGLSGIFFVNSQSVDLGYGATTSEQVMEQNQ